MLLLASTAAQAGGWPLFLGQNRDCISEEKGLLKSWPAEGPKQLWKINIGQGFSCMSTSEGRLFTMNQKDGSQWVVALDAATGEEIWKYKTGPEYTNYAGPRVTPNIDGDLLYAADANGNLVKPGTQGATTLEAGKLMLESVIAHELAHIGHRDILISSIAATLAGAIMMLGSMAKWALIFGGGRDKDDNIFGTLLMAFLAPIAAIIIQMAVSRSREYQADQTGARIAGNPDNLASALEKLTVASKRVPMASSPAPSHMFIVKPFSGKSVLGLFSTHPPVEKRIVRLR